MSKKLPTLLLALGLAVVVCVAGCSSSKKSSSSSSSGSSAAAVNAGQKVAIVAYSVPKPAYDALTAAFQKTPQGSGVTFTASYGASGTQSKNVAAGTLKADYVGFSVTPDLTSLVPAFVDPSWNSGSNKGIVSDSVVVISVRKGNPLHITGWDDLIKPGVKIVTPDPASSGSAKWNILAAYEHVISDGGTDAEATAYLTKFFANVTSRASSGAVATTQFLGGTGDVLISYENEAIDARQAGQSLDYIVPNESMLIENPAATTLTASPGGQGLPHLRQQHCRSDDLRPDRLPPGNPGPDLRQCEGREQPGQAVPHRPQAHHHRPTGWLDGRERQVLQRQRLGHPDREGELILAAPSAQNDVL